MKAIPFSTALFAIAMFLPTVAGAQFILDWDLYDNSDWAPGDLSNTFSNVNGSGIDVNVALTGDTSEFNPNRPRIRGVTGTSPYGEQFLQFGNINFDGSGSDSVTITLSFFDTGTTDAANLDALSFQFFDIDSTPTGSDSTLTNYNDRITFSGSPTITEVVTTGRTSPNHSIVGNVVQAWDGTLPRDSNAVPGLALNDLEGAVDVSYIGGGNTFSFLYDNGPNNIANPVAQNVGIYDLNFTPVPEPSLCLFFALGFLALLFRRPMRRPDGSVPLMHMNRSPDTGAVLIEKTGH